MKEQRNTFTRERYGILFRSCSLDESLQRIHNARDLACCHEFCVKAPGILHVVL
eukprot:m.97808 g.97808  ORF g.97808 m.97808 type:complete len:54 (+) comp12505_c1_seq2:113-274(+)